MSSRISAAYTAEEGWPSITVTMKGRKFQNFHKRNVNSAFCTHSFTSLFNQEHESLYSQQKNLFILTKSLLEVYIIERQAKSHVNCSCLSSLYPTCTIRKYYIQILSQFQAELYLMHIKHQLEMS